MATILIVDDDEKIVETLSIILKKEGYDILTGANGNDGLKLCLEQKVDLVITDIVMPEKEGLETIIDMKKSFPSIKIIAISGGGKIDPEDYLMLAEKFGAQKTLAKPFKKEDILFAVQEVLRSQ
jgi:DNA-binding NtrC family response regulator